MMLSTLIINGGCNHRIHREQGQFLDSSDMQLSSKDDLSYGMNILTEWFVEQKGLSYL